MSLCLVKTISLYLVKYSVVYFFYLNSIVDFYVNKAVKNKNLSVSHFYECNMLFYSSIKKLFIQSAGYQHVNQNKLDSKYKYNIFSLRENSEHNKGIEKKVIL